MADDELLTVEQAAEKLQLHPDTIRRLLRSKQIPGVKLGPRQWRVPIKAIDQYVQRALGQSTGAPDTPKKAPAKKKQ
jgi:excisionase family DNA binding protein